uniref:Synaptotagmin like 1 n=1 Tax=Rhinopithecus bieti TaxID=61621 RepID=A0A2K6KI41_RHIBE
MPQKGHPSQEGLWALPSLPMAHGPKPETEGLLDLSFLTEEEQEAIAGVLQRDARLRQLEEGRVSKLRASLADPGQLKILTGDWFQEARSQRHHNAHFGSDLVRASMRRKKSARGDQAPGSDGEAEAAVKEKEEGPEPRLTIDEAPQERLRETEGPDYPSPSVPLKGSDPEEASQAQEDPGQGDLLVCAEKADPELEPASRGGQEPRPPQAQTKAACQILENGEEAPGPDPSLDRMLSSSSSVSSLNSSTLSGSQMSLSGEAEAVQVRGSVHFALHYELGASELRVHVIQCQGLAAARRRRSDPYVKSYLLPDKQSKRKTAVKKRNLNPVFNETLRYSVPQAELQGRVLSLSVWHRESLGRNIFLGEVEVPLDTWDWGSEPTWLPLQPRVPLSPDDLLSRGLLALSLKYVPAGSEGAGLPPSGELHFWVKEARDLLPLRAGSLDTYVQCVLPVLRFSASEGTVRRARRWTEMEALAGEVRDSQALPTSPFGWCLNPHSVPVATALGPGPLKERLSRSSQVMSPRVPPARSCLEPTNSVLQPRPTHLRALGPGHRSGLPHSAAVEPAAPGPGTPVPSRPGLPAACGAEKSRMEW